MKRCPFCAEEIQDAARFCRFCGRELATAPPAHVIAPAAALPTSPPKWAIAAVVVGALLTLAGDAATGAGVLLMWAGFAWVIRGGALTRFGGGFLAATVIGAVLLAVTGRASPPRRAGSTGASASSTSTVASRVRSGVTMANYDRLETGMSYPDVVDILGEPGKEMSRSEIASITTVMYMWSAGGFGGGNMNAMFQNGGLISKAQFGLR